MDTQILRQILSREFYEVNKTKLTKSLFDDEVLDLYEVIVTAHGKYQSDLTAESLYALWLNDNPVATSSHKASMRDVIDKIDHEDPLPPEIASDLLAGLWKRETGRKIANLGLALNEGKEDALDKLYALLDRVKDGFTPDDFGEECTKDLTTLLALSDPKNKFPFNLSVLKSKLYGLGRGDFGIFFARPETGKTAWATSLSCAPGGYCTPTQNLKVAILGNEESVEKTMLRAYGAWSGMTLAEITTMPRLAEERFDMIRDNVTMMNIMDWDILKIESFIAKRGFDVVFIDQADKVLISGTYERPDLKLRELYTKLREIPKRQNCALWAVSQASNEAEGKTVLKPSMMENSKTGKFAEADVIIGAGKYPDGEDGEDPTRFLTVGKNKLSGWHGTIPCKLEGATSRYVD